MKDFKKADLIREELRSHRIEPDKVRPNLHNSGLASPNPNPNPNPYPNPNPNPSPSPNPNQVRPNLHNSQLAGSKRPYEGSPEP